MLTAASLLLLLVVVIGLIVYNKAVINKYEGASDMLEGGGSAGEVSASHKKALTESELKHSSRVPFSDVYDSDGNIIVKVVRGADGTYMGADYFRYENGECTAAKRYGADGTLINKTVFKNGDGEVSKTVYAPSYDTRGRFSGYSAAQYGDGDTLIKEEQYMSNGVLSFYLTYEFDDAGRIAVAARYTAYGEVTGYTEYKYDAMGNEKEVLEKDPKGNVTVRDVNYYDTLNRLTKSEHYTSGVPGVLRNYTEYEYSENGNVVKHSYVLKDEYSMTYEEVFYDN